jgi:acyl carrier protein
MTPSDIAQLMQEIIGLDEVDVDTSFFEIGGNSFLALTLLGRIQERTGILLGLLDVIQAPTATGISERLARHAAEAGDTGGR